LAQNATKSKSIGFNLDCVSRGASAHEWGASMICPDCHGLKKLFALVDGPEYCGPADIPCVRCKGTGQVDPDSERWQLIGGAHRTWRVAQWESLGECAKRIGMTAAELSGMEHGRADPTRLIADIPIELQPHL
jgi:hypothetical protein